jgi:hypothetical protein
MGGEGATLEVSESIPLVVDVITQQTGCSGLQYLNRLGETVPW